MKARFVPCVCAVALFGLSNLAFAQGQDFSKVDIKATKVAGNVYMLEGAGGNIAASVGADGVVLVDDQYAPLADKISAALKKLAITDKPVRFVINTHYHGDHTGGNPVFSKTATIIAHDNVRKRLKDGGTAGNGESLNFTREAAPKEALPIITFEHDVAVHLNGEEIRALHLPSGHTDGDSVIYFSSSNVVHMGDNFITTGFPFIDFVSGGSIQGMIEGVEKAVTRLPADVKVIPGHGKLSTLDDVRAFITMLKATKSIVEKALAKGMSLADMKKTKILHDYEKYSGGFISTDQYIESIYSSLTKKAPATPFVKHN